MDQDATQHGRFAGPVFTGPAQVALWLIVVLLAVIATIMLLGPGGTQSAQGQVTRAGAAYDPSGVFIVPGQLGKDLWGLYVIDSRVGTLVLYYYNPNTKKLTLAAARSFVNDRYLEDYNTDPPPREIAEMIENLRRMSPPPAKDNSGGGQ
ncbi:MAG: hypothetical protein BIFFINMI_00111 [Phycisphaerae bacterium]|nr:hypothetical protein [Phycisphaerae bacterium]